MLNALQHFSCLFGTGCKDETLAWGSAPHPVFVPDSDANRCIPNTLMNDTDAEPPPSPQFWGSRTSQSPPELGNLGDQDLYHSQIDLVLDPRFDQERQETLNVLNPRFEKSYMDNLYS